MKKIEIPQYQDYELHYSDNEQLVYSKKSEKYLKNILNHNGYYHVRLCNSEGVKTWCLHRIVWVCFNGDIPENLQVNHINECKTDNRIDNLNLMTRSENINYGTRNQRHAEKMKIKMIGKNNRPKKAIVGVNKKTLDIIEFPSAMQAQRTDKRFNNAHIIQCCQHKTYKSVNGYYFFYKDEFNQLLDEYQGNIEKIINYKLSRY